jgi:electron transfer flavoprotein alpha subunit
LRHESLSEWAGEKVAAALATTLPESCRIIFLPGGPRGEEVAAVLAARAGLEWVPDVLSLSATRTGTLEIVASLPGGKLARTYRAAPDVDVDAGALIVTLREGVGEARREATPRALERGELSPPLDGEPGRTRVHEWLPADPKTQDITHARRIVSGGRGTGGPEGMRLVESLSEALGASLAASRMAVDLGWAPVERQVGQTGKTVKPDLYVACGISGASHHLAGMRESRHVIAINPDPRAPIHEVAHLSLKGDLHEVVPAIREALARRKQADR